MKLEFYLSPFQILEEHLNPGNSRCNLIPFQFISKVLKVIVKLEKKLLLILCKAFTVMWFAC